MVNILRPVGCYVKRITQRVSQSQSEPRKSQAAGEELAGAGNYIWSRIAKHGGNRASHRTSTNSSSTGGYGNAL